VGEEDEARKREKAGLLPRSPKRPKLLGHLFGSPMGHRSGPACVREPIAQPTNLALLPFAFACASIRWARPSSLLTWILRTTPKRIHDGTSPSFSSLPSTVERGRTRGDLLPAPISSVPLPLRRLDRRRRGWGTGKEVAVVHILI